MLEHAWYSVISPEGCAGILWQRGQRQDEADGIGGPAADGEAPVGPGGHRRRDPRAARRRHRDHRETANTLKTYLLRYLRELRHVAVETLLERRYEKFRRMGVFLDGPLSDPVLNGTVPGPF